MADIPYILDFLARLSQNNTKEWMDAHRQDYLQARQHFKALTAWLIEQLQQTDESLLNLRPEDCMFRINRDVRFSNNKAPYKNWMSAALAEGGRHAPLAHYYIHLEPGNENLIGGGIYTPSPEQLRKIRQEVDYNAGELKEIVEAPPFKSFYGPIQGDKLQRPPKGYAADHPNIEFLKLKSFFAMHTFSDEEARRADFPQRMAEGLRVVQPFNEYLNVAVS
jgi:uncharacterized protein (TIGR02453 family)